MPAYTVKNIPDEVYRAIKENAARHKRSINNEMVVSLEAALRHVGRPPRTQAEVEEILRKVRRLRKKCKRPILTDEFLEQARNEGRL